MRIETGDLWQCLLATTEAAINCGALHSIDTAATELQQDGMSFMVRVATNLLRKARDRQQRANGSQNGEEFNPFLPPEPELTVGAISATHLAVLNKFNVVQHHLLIVTRDFEHQETLLTQADFEALWHCLREYPALGFYNGGAEAGASQRHKHLQLVPLPLYGGRSDYPFADCFASAPQGDRIQSLRSLPFLHAWSRLPVGLGALEPVEAARQSLNLYREMLKLVGIKAIPDEAGVRQSAPYNLLMTDVWMLLVPRSQEFSQGISVNALGYVGSLFVKDSDGLEIIRRSGPITLLREVSQSSGELP